VYNLLKRLATYQNTINSYAYGEYAHASLTNGTPVQDVATFLRDGGLQDIQVLETQPTIEDCFIKLLKN
jgi:ABC-2 type transport system ATP-binding protein